MKYFFVINPGSHQKRSAKFIPELLRRLDRERIDYAYERTKTLDDAQRISAEANAKGFGTIVAVGGDGTINGVINGFYDNLGRRISDANLGVIHTGTSPDICRSYGIPTRASLALETLLKGRSRTISVAMIEHDRPRGTSRTGYFACCASLGIGAQVASRSNSGIRKYLGDSLGTFSAILSSLLSYRPSDLILRCDGREVCVKKNFNTFVGKTTYIASGLKVAHELSVEDDRLYVLSMKGLNLTNIVPALKAIYSGKQGYDKEYFSMFYARTIEAEYTLHNDEIEFDGDPRGFLPCRISIAPDFLEVITDEP